VGEAIEEPQATIDVMRFVCQVVQTLHADAEDLLGLALNLPHAPSQMLHHLRAPLYREGDL
jgi:hypothetical protein